MELKKVKSEGNVRRRGEGGTGGEERKKKRENKSKNKNFLFLFIPLIPKVLTTFVKLLLFYFIFCISERKRLGS